MYKHYNHQPPPPQILSRRRQKQMTHHTLALVLCVTVRNVTRCSTSTQCAKDTATGGRVGGDISLAACDQQRSPPQDSACMYNVHCTYTYIRGTARRGKTLTVTQDSSATAPTATATATATAEAAAAAATEAAANYSTRGHGPHPLPQHSAGPQTTRPPDATHRPRPGVRRQRHPKTRRQCALDEGKLAYGTNAL